MRLVAVPVESDLDQLLSAMSPQPRPGAYVFVVVDASAGLPDVEVLASVVEPEGLTLVVPRQDADRAGLSYEFVAGWIVLEVHSALDAVGLTAAVSAALAAAGISCNVLAGYHHDHLLVPLERLDDALDVLRRLSNGAGTAEATPAEATPTVELRRAGPQDAPAVTSLVRSAYQPWVARVGREPAPMTVDYARALTEAEAWVAEQSGRLVGLLLLVPGEDHLLLQNLAVAPEAQGRGIGGRLLRLAEEQARARGFGEVRLHTNAAMTENVELYRRHGYQQTHRAVEDGYQRVFFTKTVPAQA